MAAEDGMDYDDLNSDLLDLDIAALAGFFGVNTPAGGAAGARPPSVRGTLPSTGAALAKRDSGGVSAPTPLPSARRSPRPPAGVTAPGATSSAEQLVVVEKPIAPVAPRGGPKSKEPTRFRFDGFGDSDAVPASSGSAAPATTATTGFADLLSPASAQALASMPMTPSQLDAWLANGVASTRASAS